MDTRQEKYTQCCGNIQERLTSGEKGNLRKTSWKKGTFKFGFENGVKFQQMKIGERYRTLKDIDGGWRWRKDMVCGEKGMKGGRVKSTQKVEWCF